MSTPEHEMIPVDENGDGPCRPEDTRAFRCWCGTECGTVEHVRTPNGVPVCAVATTVDPLAVAEVERRSVPGLCRYCHAYAMSMLHATTEGEA